MTPHNAGRGFVRVVPVAAALLATLAACGGDSDGDGAASNSSSSGSSSVRDKATNAVLERFGSALESALGKDKVGGFDVDGQTLTLTIKTDYKEGTSSECTIAEMAMPSDLPDSVTLKMQYKDRLVECAS